MAKQNNSNKGDSKKNESNKRQQRIDLGRQGSETTKGSGSTSRPTKKGDS